MSVANPFHIELLQAEIARRKKKNPRYSLRAFSTSLGLAPSSLSRILSGVNEPSLTTCRNIFQELSLSKEQKRKFIDSITEAKREQMLKLLD